MLSKAIQGVSGRKGPQTIQYTRDVLRGDGGGVLGLTHRISEWQSPSCIYLVARQRGGWSSYQNRLPCNPDIAYVPWK